MTENRDMQVTRHRATPHPLAEMLSQMEASMAEDHYVEGNVNADESAAYDALKALTPAQHAVVDKMLQWEFTRGLAEGRSRQQYGEPD